MASVPSAVLVTFVALFAIGCRKKELIRATLN
jgi:hypothetical protein